jgi:two-component sensor histidine kinase
MALGRRRVVGGEAKPVIAQALALCLHELTTNAAKYGALSAPAGRVRVEWSHSAEGRLSLRWSESGGPLVQRPTRRGFGTRMLDTFMEMKGNIQQHWRPEGLLCEVSVPCLAVAKNELNAERGGGQNTD